jgi:type 1 glutamine amidotransferase
MGKGRIAALVGDYYHAPEPMIGALEECIDAESYVLEPFTDPADFPWGELASRAAVVVAREAHVSPDPSNAGRVTEAHERAIAEFVAGGGALAALHAGLANYARSGPYERTVRGTFLFHPPEHPSFSVRAAGPGHALLEGFREFMLRDEMYFVRIDSRDTVKLLEVESPDYGSSAAAWAHEAGPGRVFCFTPGHDTEVLADSNYRTFLKAGIRWILSGGSAGV